MPRPLLLTGLVAAASLSAAARSDDPAPGRIYELRTYRAHPRKLDELNARFRRHTNALFEKHGMTLVGYWTPMDESRGKADTLIYLLAFPSREAARASWAAFAEDPEWKAARAESERDGPLVASVESVFLGPTDYSPDPMKQIGEPESPRVFELRTYVASAGNFQNLHKRFREHTVELFRKHGMTSVGYWVPLDAEKGRDDTLIYLLAFPDRDAATASWKAFRDDPEWQEVFKASQPDGVPLAEKVTSVYLSPTDYSPIR